MKKILIIFCLLSFYSIKSQNAFKLKIDDKDLHFLVNSHAVPLMGITMYQYNNNQIESIVVPSIVMLAVDFGKEISDKQRGGVFSWSDIISDTKGLIVGAFITLVVNGLIYHYRTNKEVNRQYQFYKPIEF